MNFKKLLIIFTLSMSGHFNSDDESLPELGDASSSSISIASEYNLGRIYIAQVRRSAPDYSDPVTQDYTEHLVYRLSEFSELSDRRLEIVIIKDRQVNAFAAPGGIIGINAGLILHAQSEGQFASVLSHELAHLSQRHFARRLQRQKDRGLLNALTMLGSIALAGATNNPNALIVGQQALNQQSLTYSRGNEQEADRIGFKTMVNAGFNPRSMSEMFETLQSMSRLSGSNDMEFLRSHPLTKKRISDSISRAREYPRKEFKENLDYYLVRQRSVLNFSKFPRQVISKFKEDLRKSSNPDQTIIAEYGLSRALSKIGKHEEALSYARKALSKAEENLLLQIGLLEAHIAANNLFEAEALARKLNDINPKNYPISMLYSKLLMNQEKYEEAESLLKDLALKRSFDPQIWYWLAEVQGLGKNIISLHLSRAEYFFLTGNYDKALEHLKMALDLIGNNFQLNESIQNKIEKTHKYKESLKSLT